MKYVYTTQATDWQKQSQNSLWGRFFRVVLFFIPRANPDQEKLYPEVARWFLELDENAMPCREIGIDKNNVPLFAAPNDRNFGFWTDSNVKFDLNGLKQASREEFEAMWLRVKQKP